MLSIMILAAVVAAGVLVYNVVDYIRFDRNLKMYQKTFDELLNNNDYFGLRQLLRDGLSENLIDKLSNKEYKDKINYVRNFCGYEKY